MTSGTFASWGPQNPLESDTKVNMDILLHELYTDYVPWLTCKKKKIMKMYYWMYVFSQKEHLVYYI